MIKKIVALRGIGRFEGFKATGDVTFAKFTLVFAENGVGKTTLCDVIRSLQTGDPDYIMGRRTLGSVVEPEATVLLNDGSTARFSGGRWSNTPAGGCTIFDQVYVRDNVHAGEVVDIEHKRALFSLVVGELGVTLHRRVNDLERQRSDLNGPLKLAKQRVEAALPAGMNTAAFLELSPDPDIDTKIAEAERVLAAANEEDTIRRHRLLGTLAVPALPADLPATLAKTLEDVSAQAQSRLDAHVAHLGSERAQRWLSFGLTLARGESCPFCAQSIGANDLVTAYKACFSAAYEDLAREAAGLRRAVEQALGSATVAGLETALARNAEALDFWSRYCDLAAPPAIDPAAVRSRMGVALEAALALAERKAANPLASVTYDDRQLGRPGLDALAAELNAYNAAVGTANAEIEARRGALQGVGVGAATAGLEALRRRKRRFENPVKAACDDLVALETRRESLTAEKEAAKRELDANTAAHIRDYEVTLNKHLRYFMVGFQVRGTKAEYPRGLPSSSYQLLINDVPVELGGDKTTFAEPSFRNTLSGGDRSALALSFFMAQLERAVSQPDIAIILDDPFQSQDAFRKMATAHQIKRAGERCGQVIVLSHDPAFLKLVWDKLPPDQRKALRLTPLGKNTGLAPHDVEAHLKPEHEARIATIQRYVNEGAGDPRDVAQKLRPALERHCKVACPGEFSDTLMVGEICKKVREAGPSHALHNLLDELDEINDYAKQYHHASNADHASVPIVEGELKGYSQRVLELMRLRV